MEPVYVGGNDGEYLADAPSSLSLTSLTGGAGSSVQAGDIVVVAVAHASVNGNAPSLSTSGYTEIANITASDTTDTNLLVAYKVMGSTPDTAVVAAAASAGARTMAVHVWRKVSKTTPLDVTSETSTGSDSSAPQCPTITPVTSGSVVVIIGANATTTDSRYIDSAPGSYTNLVKERTQVSHTTGYSSVAIASKSWSGGAENPGDFVINGAGTSSSDSWCAVTLVLRKETYHGDFFNFIYN